MSYVVVFFCVIIILAKTLNTAFAFSISGFAFVKQHAPQEQLKNEAVVLVRRATGFVQASVIVGQETDLLPLLRTCENYSKAPYVVVCCFGSSYQ